MKERDERSTNVPDERLSFAEAATRLGISVDAVRMRVKRGSLAAVRIEGVPHVLWPPRPAPAERSGTNEERAAERSANDPLVAALTERIASLERLLEAEMEARRRADHLLAGAMERLAALPATTPEQPTIREGAGAANQAPGRAKTIVVGEEDAPTPTASPWSRFLRWLRSG